VALSGASQHVSGCSGSKNIVAINKDAEANIFREARYGVGGRLEEGAAGVYRQGEGVVRLSLLGGAPRGESE
jgi:hypothetical protein